MYIFPVWSAYLPLLLQITSESLHVLSFIVRILRPVDCAEGTAPPPYAGGPVVQQLYLCCFGQLRCVSCCTVQQFFFSVIFYCIVQQYTVPVLLRPTQVCVLLYRTVVFFLRLFFIVPYSSTLYMCCFGQLRCVPTFTVSLILIIIAHLNFGQRMLLQQTQVRVKVYCIIDT